MASSVLQPVSDAALSTVSTMLTYKIIYYSVPDPRSLIVFDNESEPFPYAAPRSGTLV